MKKIKTDNYLFLGLPKSGKTTYFSIMANHLQQLANRTKNLTFTFLPTIVENEEIDITQDFITDCIHRLEQQRWPKKTQFVSHSYSFMLTLEHWLWTSKSCIEYYDYPGEAFTAAFGDEDYASEEIIHIGNEVKSNIRDSKGIFLILDANEVFNSTDATRYGRNMTRLFRYIQTNNKNVKLAVIFNKLELFYGENYDLIKTFSRKYGNAYSYLKLLKHRCFNVFPLGEVETKDDGEIYPPSKLKPRNILEPVKWMIGF